MKRETPKRLLLSCLNPTATASLRGVPAPVWEEVVRLAAYHGVAPLLFRRLQPLAGEIHLPDKILATLRSLYLDSMVRNLRLYGRLRDLLLALRSDGVEVLLLKGAYLAQAVYGDIALRPMADVDILIREESLPRAEQRLLRMGCAPSEENDKYARTDRHFAYLLPDGDWVELHWDIVKPHWPFRLEVDDVWQRACTATVAGVDVWVLSPEDLLLYLCLHAGFHHAFDYFGLRPLCDVAAVIRWHEGLWNWPAVQRRARLAGAAKVVGLTLALAKRLLGAEVPEEVLQGLASRSLTPALLSLAERRIFQNACVWTEPGEAEPASMSDGLGALWVSKGLMGKLSALLHVFFPSPQALVKKYVLPQGAKRAYLYYPVHWKDLAFHRARLAWRLLRRDPDALACAEREARRVERNILRDWFTSAP